MNYRPAFLLSLLACLTTLAFADDQPAIDWVRARELKRKADAGQTLTPDERAYLDRAIRERRKGQARPPGEANLPAKPTTGIKPLTELAATGKYKGEEGGLYGGGRNEPPAELAQAAKRAAAQIQSLDTAGKPAPDGKIVLISIGMSNTTQEFSRFVQLANADPEKSPNVVIVDGAQGGQDAEAWAVMQGPWDVLEQRLRAAGVSSKQVQVAWIKQALKGPARLGEFPAHAQRLQADVAKIITLLKTRYPNIRIAYLSSRIYAGYATTMLNPEPYAFESALSVRWLIRDQNHTGPVLLWGPYLWADGQTARQSDGLHYERADLAGDGTHPSDSGRKKVADLLLKFFKTDSTARTWFVR